MLEIISLRQENSKTFDLGVQDGKPKRGLLVSIAAVHYKDTYTDPAESWKDIDLTWEGNKITKAPYELTLEGKKLTIRDKKSGEVSVIELTEIGGKPLPSIPDIAWERSKGLAKAPGIVNLDDVALDTDLEIVAENGRVKFTRVLKSGNAPLDAKFQVTGNFRVRASDADGELPVETTLVDGILTERLAPTRPVQYPVRIDPTWGPTLVAASSDDCRVISQGGADPFSIVSTRINVGYYNIGQYGEGGAARFLNITIPAGSTITLANWKPTAREALTNDAVNSRLRAEANVNPATFSNVTDFNARTWTTAYVNWDAIPDWVLDTEYTSPDIKTCVQEVINLANWASGNPMAILWDDFQLRSTVSDLTVRSAYSYDSSTTKAPKLYIEYTAPAGGAHRFFQMF